MMAEITEKIIQKIQKLLNLSNNSAATDAEALAAMQMAQKLMATYNIEASNLAEIEAAQENVITVKCEHKWDAGYRKSLASVMAENYRCKCYMYGSSVMFMGNENDAKIAKSAFEFAYKFIMRRGNQEADRVRNQGYSAKGVFNSYAWGFIQGLKEVLEAQSRALMIVVPENVKNAFNEMSFGKARGGMRTGDGLYESFINKGKADAREHYGASALNAGI